MRWTQGMSDLLKILCKFFSSRALVLFLNVYYPQTTFILWCPDHGPAAFGCTFYAWLHEHSIDESIFAYRHIWTVPLYRWSKHIYPRSVTRHRYRNSTLTPLLRAYLNTSAARQRQCMSCAFVSPDWDETTKDKWGRNWRGQPDGEKQVRQDATSFSYYLIYVNSTS